MRRNDIRKLIEKILNEKLHLMLSRIDRLQNNFLNQFDHLKQLDDLIQFDLPEDFERGLQQGDDQIAILNDSVKSISTSTSQLELINHLLEGINQFCNRAALFLLRDDKLVGWKGKGFSGSKGEIGDEEINKMFVSLSADTIFRYVLETRINYIGKPQPRSDDFLIYDRLGGSKPDQILVLPFSVKGKPQAIIYADYFQKPVRQKEVEILALVGEMSLELIPIRHKMQARVKTHEFEEKSDVEISLDEKIEEPGRLEKPLKGNDPSRLARVIINDIILYNQKMIEEGIKNKNLFELLKETLLQARELYLKKFRDLYYFEEQLINVLAKGDQKLLKGYKFEVFK